MLALWVALLASHSAIAAVADGEGTFPIRQFEIDGSHLFSAGQLQQLVAPYLGETRTLDDIQRAQRAIENAYQAAGYSAVQAIAPEQEVTAGVIRIKVVEARIKRVEVQGNQHFDETNIRNSVPALKEGELPNLRRISENIQLANENPAKNIELLLNSLAEEGALEARVQVDDDRPLRTSASLDNTGNDSSGNYRIGATLQYANLFNRDHVATLAYTTSPEEPDKVDIFSFSYRLPLYAWGDNIDLIYGYSSVDSARTQTVAGPLNFSGDGRVFIARYNHYFPRKGEYSSRLTLGWDHRQYDNACDIGGTSCGSADADVTVRPLSLTWIGQWAGRGKSTDFFIAVARNIPGGVNGDDAEFAAVRQGADADFAVLRAGGSLVRTFNGDWQGRVSLNGQYAPEPLVAGEQLGLAGATAVRGFNERAIATDSGVVANLELHSPNFARAVGLNDNQSLRALVFLDAADGNNHDIASATQVEHATLASAGVGLRAEWSKRASLRLDIARVLNTDSAVDRDTGDVHGHFALNVLF